MFKHPYPASCLVQRYRRTCQSSTCGFLLDGCIFTSARHSALPVFMVKHGDVYHVIICVLLFNSPNACPHFSLLQFSFDLLLVLLLTLGYFGQI